MEVLIRGLARNTARMDRTRAMAAARDPRSLGGSMNPRRIDAYRGPWNALLSASDSAPWSPSRLRRIAYLPMFGAMIYAPGMVRAGAYRSHRIVILPPHPATPPA